MTMHVVHVVGSTDRSGAGVAAAVCGVCSHLSREVEVTIVTSTRGGDCYPVDARVRRICRPGYTVPILNIGIAPGFSRTLHRVLRDRPTDLLHVHGLWMAEVHAACAAARRMQIPYVISPHGMLMPWALRHHAWRKRLPWLIYQKRDIEGAAALHATSGREAESLARWAGRVPVTVIPHGIELRGWQLPNNGRMPFRCLFLGRLHPCKGLLNLIDAWALVRPANWICVLAGPDEAGHRAELEERIRRHGLMNCFQFTGGVEDAAKWELYRSADLFVLPSLTENFGLVVLEALSCGLPVLASTATDWMVLTERACGWVAQPDAEPLARALATAVAMDVGQRRVMGEAGRRLVVDEFDWHGVDRRMVALYRSVAGRTGKKAEVAAAVSGR